MEIGGIYMRTDNKNHLITKGNELIEARYKLTINQQRVLLSLSTQVRHDDADFKDYIVRVDELAKMWGIETSQNLYQRIEEAIDDLMADKRGSIRIEEQRADKTKVINYRWLTRSEYIKGSGEILLRLDPSVKPFYLQLKEKFTQYHLSAVIRFNSSYSIRIYELLKLKQNMGKGGQFWREFTLLELREKLGIEQELYPKFADLHRRAIKPALKEINDHSDLAIIQVDYIKQGKAVAGLKIYAEPKNQMVMDYDDTPEAQQEQEKQEAKTEKKLPKIHAELLAVGVSDTTARNWIKKYGSKRIARNLAYTLAMKQTQNISSIPAYLAKIISQDIGEKWAEEQKKKEEASKQQQQAEKKKEQEYEAVKKQDNEKRQRLKDFFAGLNEDEKAFYLDEVEVNFKGMKKSMFQIEKSAYLKANSQKIFSAYILDIEKVLNQHGIMLI